MVSVDAFGGMYSWQHTQHRLGMADVLMHARTSRGGPQTRPPTHTHTHTQVRTWRRLPQHTLHCGLVYVLAAHQLRLPHAAPLAAITWLAGLVTCLVLEVPRRIDFAAMHCGPAAAAVHQAARAALPPPAGQSGQQAPMQAR